MNSSHVRIDPNSLGRRFDTQRQFYSRAAQVIGADRALRESRPRRRRRILVLALVCVFLIGLALGFWVGRVNLVGSQPAVVSPQPTVVTASPVPAGSAPIYRQRLR